MSETKQPGAGSADAGTSGIKRRHFIYYVAEKTDRLLKIEEVDEKTGQATEVDIQFAVSPTADAAETESMADAFEDEETAPYGPYGGYPPPGTYQYGPYPPAWPFGIFWVPVAFPFLPPPPMGGARKRDGARRAHATESARGAESFDTLFEGPGVKASGAITFEAEGPGVKARALSFEPEGPIVKAKPVTFDAEGPGVKAGPVSFKEDEPKGESPGVKAGPADLKDADPPGVK